MTTLWLLRAFVLRDWRVTTSYRLPFIFDVIGTFFELGVFFFMGRYLDDIGLTESEVIGGDFFSFVVFGIVLTAFVATSVSSFAQRLRTEQTTGTLEALFASPAPPGLIILGSAAYDLLEAAVFAVLTVILAALLFGLDLHVSPASAIAGLAATLATIVLFAAIGITIAGAVIVFKQVGSLIGFMTSALALLGGVYYEVDVLPGPLQAVSNLSPFTWALQVLRSAFLHAEPRWGLLGLLSGAALVALPAGLRVFSVALRRAERSGTLAQY